MSKSKAEDLQLKIKNLTDKMANLNNERLAATLELSALKRQENLDRFKLFRSCLSSDLVDVLAPLHTFNKRTDNACDDKCTINPRTCSRCALLEGWQSYDASLVYSFEFTCKVE